MRSRDPKALESVVSHQALKFSPIADGFTLVPSPGAHTVAHQIANVAILISHDAQEGEKVTLDEIHSDNSHQVASSSLETMTSTPSCRSPSPTTLLCKAL